MSLQGAPCRDAGFRTAAPGHRGKGKRAGQCRNTDHYNDHFQNYFRMFDKLAGMTGTAKTEEDEFSSIYNLNVITIPIH